MRLSSSEISQLNELATRDKIELAALVAVIEVESGGQIFAADMEASMPVIRWEGHYFYKLLKGKERDEAVRRGLASPKAGAIKNPSAQRERYENILAPAARINSNAAYSSISIGVGQVMGSHYSSLGFDSARGMFDYATRGLAAQADIMLRFIRTNRLIDELQRHDWSAFARAYNGPNYAKYGYHTKIADAYARALKNPLIAELNVKHVDKGSASSMLRMGSKGSGVREIQQLLVRTGESIKVDGDFGPATRDAVVAFQTINGLEADGVVGPRTYAALTAYKASNELTVGQQGVIELDEVKAGGAGALVGVGAAEAANKLSDIADKMQGVTGTMEYLANGMYALSGILVVGGLIWGAYGYFKSKQTFEGV